MRRTEPPGTRKVAISDTNAARAAAARTATTCHQGSRPTQPGASGRWAGQLASSSASVAGRQTHSGDRQPRQQAEQGQPERVERGGVEEENAGRQEDQQGAHPQPGSQHGGGGLISGRRSGARGGRSRAAPGAASGGRSRASSGPSPTA